ncbi:MAG: phosphoglucosamine mutase [Bacilli bacterium]|nr:phosphoglucosamine mutase [Bacilli bacterium]
MKYFGTDGIRGRAHDFLSYELAFRLGSALKILGNSRVDVAIDTRESGPILAKAVIDGANNIGLDVVFHGVLPTPALAHLSALNGSTGVMITASHNPFHDNGLKVFDCGMKLLSDTEVKIESEMDSLTFADFSGDETLPAISDNSLNEYLELYKSFTVKTDFKVGLDLANGATTRTGEAVFKRFSDLIVVVGNAPDGRNINDNCGSTHPDLIQTVVRDNQLDYGFAFDGDGDRLTVVDHDGKLYDGDLIIYVIAVYLKQKGYLKHNQVVLTKMSNIGIIKALANQGISVVEANVGDKYVLELLEANDLTIGGENSGHIINRALLNTGDGVLNAAYLLSLLHSTGKSLAELTANIKMYPDKLVNLKGIDRRVLEDSRVLDLIRETQARLGSDGKLLIRPSGTEPLVRIFVSAASEDTVNTIVDQFVSLLNTLK